MFEDIQQHRAAVAEQIQKAMEIGFTGNELEKAHKVGDVHPNGKWVWTQLPSGKYDWRVIKKTSAPSGGSTSATAQKQTSEGKKSWDNLSDFYKNGSDERKMWMEWDRFQKTGDHNRISSIRKILEKKFPNVSSWKHFAPNMNSSKLVAVGADGKEIASIDFGGKGVDLPKLQTFMDKCSAVNKKEASSGNKGEEKKPKVSAFVTKTMDEIKKTMGWRNYTDEKMASIAKKIQENEELAKKVMSGKFPTASWSAIHPNEESVAWGKNELIFSAYKSVHSSRYAAHDGQTDYHYSVKIRYYGNTGAKEIARGSYSSGRYGGTAAEAKKECKIDALLRLINE